LEEDVSKQVPSSFRRGKRDLQAASFFAPVDILQMGGFGRVGKSTGKESREEKELGGRLATFRSVDVDAFSS